MSAETLSAPLSDYVDSPAQLDYLPDASPTWLRPVVCQPLTCIAVFCGEALLPSQVAGQALLN